MSTPPVSPQLITCCAFPSVITVIGFNETTMNVQPSKTYAFQDPNSKLVLIPKDTIDVEEESRLYDSLCDDDDASYIRPKNSTRAQSPKPAPSIFSNDIWLGDNSGESLAFARDVEIRGWTNVGDKLGGAYVVYECVIRTREGTVIYAHKRYSDFLELYNSMHRTLPRKQHPFIPAVPPKSPLARYRSSFLDRRRRLLQHWLSSIMLHPDIGGCQVVREWIMD